MALLAMVAMVGMVRMVHKTSRVPRTRLRGTRGVLDFYPTIPTISTISPPIKFYSVTDGYKGNNEIKMIEERRYMKAMPKSEQTEASVPDASVIRE